MFNRLAAIGVPLLTLALAACPADPLPGEGCVYDGTAHRPGGTFPSTDGCNICSCAESGAVTCTEKACFLPSDAMSSDARDGADAGAPSTCDFINQYDYGLIGGLRLSVDRSFLAAGSSYRHTRTSVRDPQQALTCAPAVPPCGTTNVITAADIETRDLRDADVKVALAQSTPPLYGHDSRPVDGVVFEFKRADGHGFLVGSDCPTPAGTCIPIPAGIQQLRNDLLALDTQQLSTTDCQKAGFPAAPAPPP